METCFLDDDVANGFRVRLLEGVPADLSFKGGIRFALTVRDELLIAVLRRGDVWRSLEPGSCRLARGSGGGGEFVSSVAAASHASVGSLIGPHRGSWVAAR